MDSIKLKLRARFLGHTLVILNQKELAKLRCLYISHTKKIFLVDIAMLEITAGYRKLSDQNSKTDDRLLDNVRTWCRNIKTTSLLS